MKYHRAWNKKDLKRVEGKIRDFFSEYGTLQVYDVEELGMLLGEEVSPVLKDSIHKLEKNASNIMIIRKVIFYPKPPHQEWWIDYIPF